MNEGLRPQDAILSTKFVDYIEDNQITSKELRDAYYTLLDVIEEKQPDRVQELVTYMNVMSKQGYPLNRFVETISQLESWEYAEADFAAYVDSLPITDKEKSLLKSIPEKSRNGEVTIALDDEHVANIKIENASKFEGFYLAFLEEIQKVLTKINPSPQNKVSFWFEEK